MAPIPTEFRHRAPTLSEASDFNENANVNGSTDLKRKLVGVDGKWYDVTNFIDKHPGGPVLEHFIGEDATAVFHAYRHPEYVLKNRKPVSSYVRHARHPADLEFEALLKKFEDRGYFVTDFMFYVKKSLVVAAIMLMAVLLTCFTDQWYTHYLGAVCLAFFWQQSGFIMHEFMHGQVFRSNVKDRCGGLLFGTVFFGMSAHWWQDEHIIHHGMTNTVDVALRFVDPQMWESVWAQNVLLFPLFKGWLQYCLVKIQHITFIPVVMFCGRAEIILDSYRLERRWYEWIAIVLHWCWMVPLLNSLPTWHEVFVYYFIAASVEGIFHFQLILSHYCRYFIDLTKFHKTSWYEFQVLSNMNIECPRWQDWYYGGLNYHIEHHLFPKIARKYLRTIAPEVKDICIRYNIEYDMRPFWDCLTVTLQHLKNTASHYKLEFR